MHSVFLYFWLVALGNAIVADTTVLREFRNSIEQRMVPIQGEKMSFMMGYSETPLPPELGQAMFPDGDSDEKPYHRVMLTPFYMSSTEVTNRQYEAFDPSHKALRGKFKGLSKDDDEAVVFVSWENATRFAAWLGEQEGRSYRLPTEAEWEYAARGKDSNTQYKPFWTGHDIPAEMKKLNAKEVPYCKREGHPEFDLTVGQTMANSFGLHDTIGNVEEWCSDWYGSYEPEDAQDPQGPEKGMFKVTRGGSHSTTMYYLRTANRAAALPDDRSWFIGFRVVMDADAKHSTTTETVELAAIKPSTKRAARRFSSEIGDGTGLKEKTIKSSMAPDHFGMSKAERKMNTINLAEGIQPPIIRKYVNIPSPGITEFPFIKHNHEPTIVTCPNGDLLASWFSTYDEKGREAGLVSARLPLSKSRSANWTEAETLLNVPDRCQCCTAFYMDKSTGILYHFSAVSAAGAFTAITGIIMASDDCGLTWTKPEIIWPEHSIGHQIVVTIIKTSQGEVLVPCDHSGHDLFWMTGDESVIQRAQSDKLMDPSSWQVDTQQHTGIHHTAIVELRNSSILAIGRGHEVDGTFAFSISNDWGRTFKSHGSPFSGLYGGQRPVMIRLGDMDQPLLLCLFANNPMPIKHSGKGSFNITGLFCALSLDDGNTWPGIRPITDDMTSAGHAIETLDKRPASMSFNTSEPLGYLAACVGQDGMINVITSQNHYMFSAGWLLQLPPPPPSLHMANGNIASNHKQENNDIASV